MGLGRRVTCFAFCVCLVIRFSSVTDLTIRQRIYHLEFLQLNRRAVVIGMIVIVWFLRVCDSSDQCRLCDPRNSSETPETSRESEIHPLDS